MFNVHSLMDFGYGEGEMFFRDFLAQFGEVDDWAINDEESNPEKWKPVYFEVNERGRALGQKAIELEQQFNSSLKIRCSPSSKVIQTPLASILFDA